MKDEYTIEVYREDGKHYAQVGSYYTYKEAAEYTVNNPLIEENLYYSIWCIEYDGNGEEKAAYPVV